MAYLPSPLVGEGGSTARSGGETDEGYVSADSVPAERYPSSGASRHLLPQGEKGRKSHHSGGSTASSYSFLNRAISSAAGSTLGMLPTPWPEPQISFHAFGLARSPAASVPKLIFEASDCSRLSGSIPAATIEGLR